METYTGDEGDEALDAGMEVMDGTEDRRDGWRAINRTRDYILQRIAALWPLSIGRGGTGADNAGQARINLNTLENAGAYPTRVGWNGVRLQYDVPGYVFPTQLPNMSEFDALKARVNALDGGS